ncbi:MAG: hypothetical protein PHQ93_03150 [Sulfurimonas sp.]|uniref:hypothetical protein n=1 Tax=Sulfurimonas sp. TaxID=2022749 RepID=UPI002601B4E6|nr:hypothetical protein [Sulfurimonas sp.]MDD5400168.1 hypothetical protein [Sulfurimonas sp.]
MQRSISNKNSLTPYIYAVVFVIYTALSGIYLFLPPLLAILFILFSKALKEENAISLFLIFFCLLLFEAQNGYVLFSTIIYFTFIYKYLIPKLIQIISCNACIKIATVIFVYIGFFVFHLLLSKIFLLPAPSIDYHVIYYMVIEFFIMSIL